MSLQWNYIVFPFPSYDNDVASLHLRASSSEFEKQAKPVPWLLHFGDLIASTRKMASGRQDDSPFATLQETTNCSCIGKFLGIIGGATSSDLASSGPH
jgi:hypothetical protein